MKSKQLDYFLLTNPIKELNLRISFTPSGDLILHQEPDTIKLSSEQQRNLLTILFATHFELPKTFFGETQCDSLNPLSTQDGQ